MVKNDPNNYGLYRFSSGNFTTECRVDKQINLGFKPKLIFIVSWESADPPTINSTWNKSGVLTTFYSYSVDSTLVYIKRELYTNFIAGYNLGSSSQYINDGAPVEIGLLNTGFYIMCYKHNYSHSYFAYG